MARRLSCTLLRDSLRSEGHDASLQESRPYAVCDVRSATLSVMSSMDATEPVCDVFCYDIVFCLTPVCGAWMQAWCRAAENAAMPARRARGPTAAATPTLKPPAGVFLPSRPDPDLGPGPPHTTAVKTAQSANPGLAQLRQLLRFLALAPALFTNLHLRARP